MPIDPSSYGRQEIPKQPDNQPKKSKKSSKAEQIQQFVAILQKVAEKQLKDQSKEISQFFQNMFSQTKDKGTYVNDFASLLQKQKGELKSHLSHSPETRDIPDKVVDDFVKQTIDKKSEQNNVSDRYDDITGSKAEGKAPPEPAPTPPLPPQTPSPFSSIPNEMQELLKSMMPQSQAANLNTATVSPELMSLINARQFKSEVQHS